MLQKRIRTLATITALVSSITAPALAQQHPPHTPPAGGGHGHPPHGHGTSTTTTTTTTPATPAVDPTVAQARAEFDQGRALLEAQPAEALPHFQHAYELRPNPVVLLPIAQCQENTGHVPDAIATLQRYLHDRPDAPDRAAVQARVDELGRRPATLHIASLPPGGRVLLDGHDTGQTTPVDLPAPPGHHAVSVEMAGHDRFHRDLDVQPAERSEVNAELVASAPVAPATSVAVSVATTPSGTSAHEAHPSNGIGPAVIVASVVAGAGLVSGITFGLIALGDLSDFNRMPTAQTRDDGQLHSLLSDISFGTAILAASVAIVVAATNHHTDDTETPARAHRTAPRVIATPGGIHVTF